MSDTATTPAPEWEGHRCPAEFTVGVSRYNDKDVKQRCNLAVGHPGDHQTGFTWGESGYRGNG